jgi:ribulose-phosphate 3-epimerase
MYEIIPAILEENWQQIEGKIDLVKPFAKTIQIDIIDGEFVPLKTFLDPKPFVKYSSELFLEAHFMVENPIRYLESFARAGFKRFIGQIEKMPDQIKFVEKAKTFGEVGLAIDQTTDINSIKVPLNDLDCVLIMLVKAGSSGQKYDLNCLEKIKELKLKIKNLKLNIPVEVDGGVNLESAIKAKEVGATRFSVNSFLFKNNNPYEQYNLLKKCLE